jgi:hypothetical protein
VRTRAAEGALVGILSDTHGKLDYRVFDAFEGVERILHAGDIGGPDILWKLEGLAPVTAVLGNVDVPLPGYDLGALVQVAIRGVEVLLIHDRHALRAVPEEVRLVVCGHTHVPLVDDSAGVLVVNPGAVRRPRSGVGRSVALLRIAEDNSLAAEIVPLDRFGPKDDSA